MIAVQDDFYNAKPILEGILLAGFEAKYYSLITVRELVNVLVCNQTFLNQHSSDLNEFKSLKLIQLISSGHEQINNDVIPEGVQVSNSRGVYSRPIAEFITSFVLNHFKGTNTIIEDSKNLQWNKNRNVRDISGLNAVIIGSGSIAEEVFRMLTCLGVNSMSFSRTQPVGSLSNHWHRISELSYRIADCDICIIAAALNNESLGIIGPEEIRLMNDHSLIVNISREGTIRLKESIDIIKQKEIHLVMDSFNNEPVSFLEEYADPHLVVSPHVSWFSETNWIRLLEIIIVNTNNLLSSKTILNRVY